MFSRTATAFSVNQLLCISSEELIDALRYAEMAKKQIAWLTAENERLKSNEALRWQTLLV